MSTERDVERFGRWAETYESSLTQRLFFTRVQDRAIAAGLAAVPDPQAVLDVGCGTGSLLRRLAPRVPRAALTGLDPAEPMVLAARAALPPASAIRFVEGFAEELPFDDGSFDLVLTTMSFHHWADQAAALREVRRVLRAGGAFVLTDALAAGAFRFFMARSSHGTFLTPPDLAELFVGAGFSPPSEVMLPGYGHTIRATIGRSRSD